MSTTALLVIDAQDGIVNDPDFPMFEPDALIERINRLIDAFHQAHLPVVFIRHTEGEGSPLQQGLPGWELEARLHVESDDVHINKTTPDSFLKTDLKAWLSKHAINDVVLCGLQTDYCVDTTTRSAFSHGIQVTLVEDAHSTCDSGTCLAKDIIAHHNRILGSWFASVKSTSDVLNTIH